MSLFLSLLWSGILILWSVWFIWMPILALILAWELWKDYIRYKYDVERKRVLLQIKLPRELNKSPLAMEVVLSSLHIGSRESTFIDRLFKGQQRPRFSLEIASIDGNVNFYIWTEKDFRQLIEAQIYSQYPNIEVHEVEDYTIPAVYDPKKTNLFAFEIEKTNPIHAYPIKTYVDYGLGDDPDEELKSDPLTPMLEVMGSIKRGEQIWFQIIFKMHKKEMTVFTTDKKTKKRKKYKKDWKHFAEEERNKILEKFKEKDKEGKLIENRRPTKGEQDVLAALEKTVSKLAFDVGMRCIYFANKDDFSNSTRAAIMASLKPYAADNLNSLKPERTTSYDYWWQDISGKRVIRDKKRMIYGYKTRSYFTMYKRKAQVMNTEELATLYHFPGTVAGTPTLTRIMSKKSEAPANLPI